MEATVDDLAYFLLHRQFGQFKFVFFPPRWKIMENMVISSEFAQITPTTFKTGSCEFSSIWTHKYIIHRHFWNVVFILAAYNTLTHKHIPSGLIVPHMARHMCASATCAHWLFCGSRSAPNLAWNRVRLISLSSRCSCPWLNFVRNAGMFIYKHFGIWWTRYRSPFGACAVQVQLPENVCTLMESNCAENRICYNAENAGKTKSQAQKQNKPERLLAFSAKLGNTITILLMF